MRVSTIGYSIKQGGKNIWRNKLFSVASIATMGACIFLFGLVFSIIVNFRYIVKNVEEGVSMTVMFEDGVDQATMDAIGKQIESRTDLVREVHYVSADQAWEEFAQDYFPEDQQNLKSGFKDNDNPLLYSASYEVYARSVEVQNQLREYIQQMDGVRVVNQATDVTSTLSSFNKMIGYISIAIIAILLAVAIFLISNTVAIGISVRKEEIGIMKLIGATNFFVRFPFIVEGVILGLVGSAIPLGLLYVLYEKVVGYILEKFSVLTNVIQFMDVNQVFVVLLPVGLLLGMGIGFVGSMFTIRKHLKV